MRLAKVWPLVNSVRLPQQLKSFFPEFCIRSGFRRRYSLR